MQQKTAETIRIADKWEASDGPITPTFAQNDVSSVTKCIYICIYVGVPIFHGGASFIIFREGILAAADRARKRIVEQTEDRQGRVKRGEGGEGGTYIFVTRS